MIDERQQELASLYAFDLLEGAERTQFEAVLAHDRALQQLVTELRQTTATLTHAAAPAVPPASLRRRTLASIAERPHSAADDARVVPFPASSATRFLPWAIAAGFALGAAWMGERYLTTSTEVALARQREQLADVALRTVQTQQDAERLIAARVASDFATFKTDAARQLADARQATAQIEQQLVAARAAATKGSDQLADTQRQLGALTEQLADARRREQEADRQVVALNDQLKSQADLAQLKIATLASMLNNSPQALAVAVWDPRKQEGVFTVEKLPASAADQRYELWVVDAKPVSAGVFSVGPDGRARLDFKPVAPVATAAKFAVSLEANDGRRAHESPGKVIMISQ